MTGDNLLELLQSDIIAILKNTPGLSDASIIAEDEGDMEKKILQKLGPLNAGAGGKFGLVAVVMLPEVDSAEPNLPGPPMSVLCEIQIIEHPLINRGATGTGIRSSVAAIRALAALQLRGLGLCALHAGDNPIKPVQVKQGYLSHTVRLRVSYRSISPPAKPANVAATYNSGNNTLVFTCATAGSAIWISTDGTFPTPTNPTASIYTAPISGPSQDTTFRAVAYVSGSVPSDLTEVNYTA